MSDSISYIKMFNQVIDEFFIELIDIFPNEPKIKSKHLLIQTMFKTNVKKVCNDFMYGSIKYLEKIAMRDETFFSGPDKPSLLDQLNFDVLWVDMSTNTKEVIWKYIKTFFMIGVKIIEMPPETHGLVNYIINN
jgi:hypothetical protein